MVAYEKGAFIQIPPTTSQRLKLELQRGIACGRTEEELCVLMCVWARRCARQLFVRKQVRVQVTYCFRSEREKGSKKISLEKINVFEQRIQICFCFFAACLQSLKRNPMFVLCFINQAAAGLTSEHDSVGS